LTCPNNQRLIPEELKTTHNKKNWFVNLFIFSVLELKTMFKFLLRSFCDFWRDTHLQPHTVIYARQSTSGKLGKIFVWKTLRLLWWTGQALSLHSALTTRHF